MPAYYVQAQGVTLEEALQSAMEHNPLLLQAHAQVEITQGKKLQAISPAPLTVGYYEEDIVGGGLGSGGQRVYSISQDFDLPLLFGSRGYLYGNLALAADYSVAYTKRSVQAEVLRSYTLLYARERQLQLLRQTASFAQQAAKIAKMKYDAGETDQLEYLQAKTTYALAEQAVLEGEQLRVEASQKLATAMGEPANAFLETSDSLVPRLTTTLETIDPSRLAKTHPSVMMAESVKEGYESDRAWRWMEYLPSFSASAFKQEYTGINGNYWGVEFGVHVPIWFFLSPRGSAHEATGYAMEAQARYISIRTEVEGRITNALNTYRNAVSALQMYQTSLLQEGREIQRTASLAFEAGELSFLEYSAAMENANAILMGYYNAFAAYYDARAMFETEIGIEPGN